MQAPQLLFDDRPAHPRGLGSRSGAGRGLLLVTLIFLASRLVTWTATYYGAWLLWRIDWQLSPPWAHQERRLVQLPPDAPVLRASERILENFRPLWRFDGAHYASIIEHGYRYVPPTPGETDRSKLEQNIAFFPLYPLVTRPLAALLGTPAAQILVANAAAFAAAVLLYLWIRRRINEPTALWSVAYVFCFPAAVYFSYGYAESLTLLLIVAALWLMDERAFLPAAVAAGLATAGRPTALAIAVVFALAWLRNGRGTPGRRLVLLVPLGLIASGGLIAYAAYLAAAFGSPLVYFANFRAGWVPEAHRGDWLEYLFLTRVWEQFKYFRDVVLFRPPIGLVNLPNVLMWSMPLSFLLLFLSLAGRRYVPPSFRPLLWLAPVIFLQSYLASGGATFGVQPIGRYMSLGVTALVVLAAWAVRAWAAAARYVLLMFFGLLQAAWGFRFGLGEWSG